MEGAEGAENKAKICFVGHSSVGKTSIIKRFVFGDFDKDSTPTQNLETTDKTIKVKGEEVDLWLCDTQGAEMS